jgi:uncharacterized protein (TIGR03067 family)
MFILVFALSLFGDPLFAQKRDRTREFERIAEVEKEIKELEARVLSLKMELFKLRKAVAPTYKTEYMESAHGKALRGKWQAVRITWGGDRVAEESLAKVHLEISEQFYYRKEAPIKLLDREKKVYDAKLPEMNGAWMIDPTIEPQSIEYSEVVQDLRRVLRFQGIYKLEGDTLTIGWLSGAEPEGPPRFDEKNLEIYRRLKDEPKKQAK